MSDDLERVETQAQDESSRLADLTMIHRVLCLSNKIPGGIGDEIFWIYVTLVLHDLGLSIDVLTHLPILYQNNPYVEHIYSYQDHLSDDANREIVSDLGGKYDMSLLPLPFATPAELSSLSRIGEHFVRATHRGYSYCIQGGDRYIYQQGLSVVEYLIYSLYRIVGQDDALGQTKKFLAHHRQVLFLSDDEKRQARQWKESLWTEHQIPDESIVIGIVLGALDPCRNYPRWGELVQSYLDSGYTVILLGDSRAHGIADQIIDSVDNAQKIISTVGQTANLRELMMRVRITDMIVAFDGGIGNMAMGLGPNIHGQSIQVLMLYNFIRMSMRVPAVFDHVSGIQTGCPELFLAPRARIELPDDYNEKHGYTVKHILGADIPGDQLYHSSVESITPQHIIDQTTHILSSSHRSSL